MQKEKREKEKKNEREDKGVAGKVKEGLNIMWGKENERNRRGMRRMRRLIK